MQRVDVTFGDVRPDVPQNVTTNEAFIIDQRYEIISVSTHPSVFAGPCFVL